MYSICTFSGSLKSILASFLDLLLLHFLPRVASYGRNRMPSYKIVNYLISLQDFAWWPLGGVRSKNESQIRVERPGKLLINDTIHKRKKQHQLISVLFGGMSVGWIEKLLPKLNSTFRKPVNRLTSRVVYFETFSPAPPLI